MNTLLCRYCDKEFTAKRNDAQRCADCLKVRKEEYRKSENGKAKRAIWHRSIRKQAIDGYGGACNCCGEDGYEFLALDHVDGGGRLERQTLSTYQIARNAIADNFPDTYQVLCHNCNQAKGWYGDCPHNRKRTV